jgi:hypothetical protein
MPLNQTTAGCNITLELDGLQSLLKEAVKKLLQTQYVKELCNSAM